MIAKIEFVDRPQNLKGLYGILQLLQGSHLDNFLLKALNLDWVAFHSVTQTHPSPLMFLHRMNRTAFRKLK